MRCTQGATKSVGVAAHDRIDSGGVPAATRERAAALRNSGSKDAAQCEFVDGVQDRDGTVSSVPEMVCTSNTNSAAGRSSVPVEVEVGGAVVAGDPAVVHHEGDMHEQNDDDDVMIVEPGEAVVID